MLSTFIKLPCVIKIFVLPIIEWPFYTGFTALYVLLHNKTIFVLTLSAVGERIAP